MPDVLTRNSPCPPPRLGSPKVSVVIPSYNRARYLPEAIESVLEQDFPDFEIVIIDDHSDDESRGVLERYGARDRRIRVGFNDQRVGLVPGFNQCLEQARGEYVLVLGSDDRLWTRHALTKLTELLDAHPTAVMAVCASHVIDERSRVLEVRDHLGRAGLKPGAAVVAQCLECNGNLIGEPSLALLRRTHARRGFHPRYRHIVDLEMWFHLLQQGDLVYTPEPLCGYRRHPDQLTTLHALHGIGAEETDWLLRDYYAQPWLAPHLSRRALFTQIYYLRKRRRKGQDMADVERDMMNLLGLRWYAALWLAHKASRPLVSLRRWFYKHLLHRVRY